MEDGVLIKEIIKTETERYGDNGKVKEKVTETREKIYGSSYTEEQIAKAKTKEEIAAEKPKAEPTPAQPQPQPSAYTYTPPANQPQIQQDKTADAIKAAAEAIDKQMHQPQQQNNMFQQGNSFTPPQSNQYNVVNRAPAPPTPAQAAATKFPWEQ